MKYGLKLTSIAAVTILVTSCASGPSAEQTCKDYFKKYGTYLATIMQGDPSAESSFASELRSLADKAPQEIAAAMRNDALDVANSSETAAACKSFLTK